MKFSELLRRQRPDPEMPVVVQVGDVIVFDGHFYRVDETVVTELSIVKAPEEHAWQ